MARTRAAKACGTPAPIRCRLWGAVCGEGERPRREAGARDRASPGKRVNSRLVVHQASLSRVRSNAIRSVLLTLRSVKGAA